MMKRTLATLLILISLCNPFLGYAGQLLGGGGGSGDVAGPTSSADNGIVRYDGTTGKLLQSYTSNTPTCGDTGICTFVAPVLGVATATSINGNTLTTGTGTLSLNNATLNVDTTGLVTDSILRYNGTSWVPGSPATSSAGPGIEFYNATPAIEVDDADNDVPINTLSKTPIVTAEQTISGAGDSASTAIAFGAWLYDTALGRTTIDAGVWQFETYVAINVAGGTTTLTRQVYAVVPVVTGTVTVTGTGTSRTATASAGTPFNTTDVTGSATSTTASYLQTPKGLYQITARTSDTVVTILTPTGYTNDSAATFNVWRKLVTSTTDDINDLGTNYTLHTFGVISGSFTITALTKLGAISFVSSSASRTITLSYDGTARNTHFSTPLVTMHNNLAGLDGGTAGQFFHLTSAEYTGTGTGNFVRLDSPTLTTLQTISGTAPSLVLTDTTASAKSLTIAVDANLAQLRESAGASGSLVVLDLANARVGIGTAAPSASLHISPSTAAALQISAFGASAGNTGELRFGELAANGANYTGFKSPDALAANVLYTLPSADGASGQTLSTNGSGALAWASTAVEYVRVQKTSNQTGITAATDITFNTTVGSIPFDGTHFTLTANKTYELEAYLTNANGSGNSAQFQWVDSTNVAIAGQNTGMTKSPTGTNDGGTFVPAHIIYTPTSNQTVHVRVTAVSGSMGIAGTVSGDNGTSYAVITQLGSTAITSDTIWSIGGNTFNDLDVAKSIGTLTNNALAFVASTTERMRILANGNVGIGTATPDIKLHVLGSSATLVKIERDSGSNSNIQYKNSNGSMYAGLSAAANFGIGSSNDLSTAYMTVLSTGNVGIGTTAFNLATTVATDRRWFSLKAAESAWLEFQSGNADGDAKGLGQIWFTFDANTVSATKKIMATITATTEGTTAADRGGKLTFFTKPDGGTITERLRISQTGNVSIGNVAPPTGGGPALAFAQGTDPTGIAANTAGIYVKDVAGTAELFTFDEAGNFTQQSAADTSILDRRTSQDAMPWAFGKTNVYSGEVWEVDMGELIAEVERLSGKQFAVLKTLAADKKADWDAGQNAQHAVRDAERIAAQTSIADLDAQIVAEVDTEKKAKLQAQRDEVKVPAAYAKKKPPKWMRDRGVASVN